MAGGSGRERGGEETGSRVYVACRHSNVNCITVWKSL